jgi:hypothetical protein
MAVHVFASHRTRLPLEGNLAATLPAGRALAYFGVGELPPVLQRPHVDRRQDFVYISDPVQILLLVRTGGTFRLDAVAESQRNKVGCVGCVARRRGWHEMLSMTITTQAGGIARRSP